MKLLAISLLVLAVLIAWLIATQPNTADTTIHPPLTPINSPYYGDRE